MYGSAQDQRAGHQSAAPSQAFGSRSRFANRNLNTLSKAIANRGLGVRSSALILRDDRRAPAKGIGIVAAPTPLNTSSVRPLPAGPATATQPASSGWRPGQPQAQPSQRGPSRLATQQSSRPAWSKDSLDIRTKLKQSQPAPSTSAAPEHRGAVQDNRDLRQTIHSFPQHPDPTPVVKAEQERPALRRPERKTKPKRIVIGDATGTKRWGDLDSDDDEDEEEEYEDEPESDAVPQQHSTTDSSVTRSTTSPLKTQPLSHPSISPSTKSQPPSGHDAHVLHPVSTVYDRTGPARADALKTSLYAQDVRFTEASSHSRGPQADQYGRNDGLGYGYRAPDSRSAVQSWERPGSFQPGGHEEFAVRRDEGNSRGPYEDPTADGRNWKSRALVENVNDRSDDGRKLVKPDDEDEDEEQLRALARSRAEREMLEKMKKQQASEHNVEQRWERDSRGHSFNPRATSPRFEESYPVATRARRDEEHFVASRSNNITTSSYMNQKDDVIPRRILANEARVSAQRSVKEGAEEHVQLSLSSLRGAHHSSPPNQSNGPHQSTDTPVKIVEGCHSTDVIESPSKVVGSVQQMMKVDRGHGSKPTAGGSVQDRGVPCGTAMSIQHEEPSKAVEPARAVSQSGENKDKNLEHDNLQETQSVSIEQLAKDTSLHDRMEGPHKNKQLFDYKSGRMVDAEATSNKTAEGKWKRGAALSGPAPENPEVLEKDRENRTQLEDKRRQERKKSFEPDLESQAKLKQEKDEDSRVRQEARAKERKERAPRSKGQLYKYDDSGLLVRVWGNGEKEEESKRNVERLNRDKRRQEPFREQRKKSEPRKADGENAAALSTEFTSLHKDQTLDNAASPAANILGAKESDFKALPHPPNQNVGEKEHNRKPVSVYTPPNKRVNRREPLSRPKLTSSQLVQHTPDPSSQVAAIDEEAKHPPLPPPPQPTWQGGSSLGVLGVQFVEDPEDKEATACGKTMDRTESISKGSQQQSTTMTPPQSAGEDKIQNRNDSINSKPPQRIHKPKPHFTAGVTAGALQTPASADATRFDSTSLGELSAPSVANGSHSLINEPVSVLVWRPETEAESGEEDPFVAATVESVAKIATDDYEPHSHQQTRSEPQSAAAQLLTSPFAQTFITPSVVQGQGVTDRWKPGDEPVPGVGSWQPVNPVTWPLEHTLQPQQQTNSTDTTLCKPALSLGLKANDVAAATAAGGPLLNSSFIGLPQLNALNPAAVWQLQAASHGLSYPQAQWMVQGYPGPILINEAPQHFQTTGVMPRATLSTVTSPSVTSTADAQLNTSSTPGAAPGRAILLPPESALNSWANLGPNMIGPHLPGHENSLRMINQLAQSPITTTAPPSKPNLKQLGEEDDDVDALIAGVHTHTDSASQDGIRSSEPEPVPRPERRGKYQKPQHHAATNGTAAASRVPPTGSNRFHKRPTSDSAVEASEPGHADRVPPHTKDAKPFVRRGNGASGAVVTKRSNSESEPRASPYYVVKKTAPGHSGSTTSTEGFGTGIAQPSAAEKSGPSTKLRTWDGPSVTPQDRTHTHTHTHTYTHPSTQNGSRPVAGIGTGADGDRERDRPPKQVYRPKIQQTHSHTHIHTHTYTPVEAATQAAQAQGKSAKPAVKRYVPKANPNPGPTSTNL